MVDLSCMGYVPVNDKGGLETNGVLIVLKEPGGKTEGRLNCAEDNKIGNGNWFYDVCDMKQGGCYRERFLDLLVCIGKERSTEELKRCFYTNICYERTGTHVDSKTGYGALRPEEKSERFETIKNAFLKTLSSETEVKQAFIFLIEDTFKTLTGHEIKPGLFYNREYPQYEEFKDGIKVTVYAIHHPVGAVKDATLISN